ncbi:tRNA lysidine(34) synthetase TilS [Paenibacillus methanolicus]|uniref:tRNA(Ile)-lysidine synthase n=1 Tax=Paenibacillus methanolicus TaxID=582686 RepID=A0A5S5BR18_9BACL|nr:tRNA lysidine(34) synthetase TilS [Paenibacillus methanolicus]TYP68013.1 tRNA(Ile)-lysidine synthase [Paenibacillus methanolicus]
MDEQELIHKVKAQAAARKLWERGDAIIVAVSGGPDSIALLDLLHRMREDEGLRLVAAHVDHGFRGEESASEAETVRRFAEKLGVPCESVFIDLPSYIEETGMNPQAAAREKRYEFLLQTARKHGARRIALGHHADDQAETVLMRILRGTGTSGLAGMAFARSEKNVQLIRPLLRINKTALEQYCRARGLTVTDDSSNRKRDYTRNRVRLDLMPVLRNYNPQLTDSLVRLSDIAAEEDDWMESEAREAFRRLAVVEADGCRLERGALLGLHVALQRRLIKLILIHMGMEKETTPFDTVESMREAAREDAASTWRIDAGGGIRFAREYDNLRFWRGEALVPGSYRYELEAAENRLYIAEAGIALSLTLGPAAVATKPAGRHEAVFDAERLAFPLVARNRLPGDRMRVIGLNGTKKVQDMFVDERIPPSRRELMPLLADASGDIIWIPGVRRGEAAQVTEVTRQVLRIRALTDDY